MRVELEAEGGAILATVGALEESEKALSDAIAVKNDAAASSNVLNAALNAEATALIKESQALDAASASADSLILQQGRLDNAFKSGVVSIKQWVNGLAEAKAEQQGQSAQLAQWVQDGATYRHL